MAWRKLRIRVVQEYEVETADDTNENWEEAFGEQKGFHDYVKVFEGSVKLHAVDIQEISTREAPEE